MPTFDFDDIQMPDNNNHSKESHSAGIVKAIEGDGGDDNHWLGQIAHNSPSVVKVIGVGGCGCNIVENICKIGIPCNNVDFALIDHAPAFLNKKTSVDKKFIVDKDDKHLDGMLRNIIGEQCKMIVIVTGVGGGYSATVVASLCRQLQSGENDGYNNVSIAISVLPFDFEKRGEKADEDIAMIAKEATKVITVDNEPKYKHILDWPILLTMNHVGQYISDLIYAIMSIILKYDYNPVNYIDFPTALKSGSKAVAATGRGSGENRATKATGNLLWNFASMGYHEFGDMKNLLLYISVSQEHHLTFDEFDEISQMMCRLFSQEANILWNVSEDRGQGDEIALTVIAIF